MLEEIWNCNTFLTLSLIFLPSSTALTIVAKLSSANTISATLFVTSVPVIPIPTPISAALILGASLTPSPVIATTLPKSLNALTILVLCSGCTLANTLVF